MGGFFAAGDLDAKRLFGLYTFVPVLRDRWRFWRQFGQRRWRGGEWSASESEYAAQRHKFDRGREHVRGWKFARLGNEGREG
jgi:hypothetical protein